MRKILLTIKDTDEENEELLQINSEITLDYLNELYNAHGLNGLSLMLVESNEQMNKLSGKQEKLWIEIDPPKSNEHEKL